MTSKLLGHVRANAIAYLALFVALSGTALAATALPRNSVGTAQIKKGAVTGKKVRKNTLTGKQIRESKLGRVPLATRALNADGAARLGGQLPSAFLGAGATAANADRLDGIDSAVFGSVKTYAGMGFEPRDSTATTKAYQGPGGISCAGASVDFTQRVDLPQGARITRLDYRFVDNNVNTSGLELRGYDTFETGGAVTVLAGTVTSNGDDGARRTATATFPTPHVVDNSRYSYQLNWSPFGCSAETQLIGGAIHYTLPKG